MSRVSLLDIGTSDPKRKNQLKDDGWLDGWLAGWMNSVAECLFTETSGG